MRASAIRHREPVSRSKQVVVSQRIERHLVVEAAGWMAKLNDVNVSYSTRRDFVEWTRLSPQHVQAFLKVGEIYGGLAHITIKETGAELVQRAKQERTVYHFEPGDHAGEPASFERAPASLTARVCAALFKGNRRPTSRREGRFTNPILGKTATTKQSPAASPPPTAPRHR
jgi:hypothetical protein